MNFALIIKNVSKHIHLTKDEENHFVSFLKDEKIKRKEFILHENEICENSIFVTNGCLRGYTIDHHGFEHILQFAPPDWWIADMYSLISQKPGNLNIDAIEDTDVLLLSRKNQEKLFTDVPKFEHFFRIITENSLVANRQRVLDNMTLTAQQRFAVFCEHYPTLIERLPQKLIASYIGVTPEFLSKVKAEYFRQR
ncbi:MAG TPA: Crp/Fnr family transcriptional regulator [Puia sp.]|nr:Crp/Fnr family transcriptional regulator [Puia sp.]